MKNILNGIVKSFGMIVLGILILAGAPELAAKADGSCTGFLEAYWSRNTNDGDSAGSFSMLGKEYTNGKFMNNYAKEMVVLYNLDQNYSSVSFLAGPMDGYGKEEAVYTVYLDGELVSTFTMDANAIPVLHTFQTTGKTQMMIRVDSGIFTRWGFVNVTATGHQWELDSQIAATVDDAGSKTYICRNCKASKTETVPAITNCPNYMTPYANENTVLCPSDEESFLMMGNTFTQGFYTKAMSTTGSASYNLNGAVSAVTFTVGALPNSGYNSIESVEQSTGTLNIYLDNQLYKSVPLSIPMMNQKLLVSTYGATVLRLEIKKHAYTNYGIGNIQEYCGSGHNLTQETELIPASIGKTGLLQYTCTKCGATRTVTLPALKGSLSADNVSVKSTAYYTGSALKPSVTVTYNGVTLKKGTDYTVTYSNNVEVGTGTVSVTGIGNYERTVLKSFKIVLKKGTTFKRGKYTYKITNVSAKTAALTKGDASLTSIAVPMTVSCGGVTLKVTEISSKAFYKSKATKATIGKNVTKIGTSAFEGCTKLKTVNFGSKVKTIGNRAFYKCTSLTKATLPAAVTTIGNSAFQGCTKLASVTIGKNVKTIGSKAFYGDKKLKTVVIQSTKLTAKTVGSNAFKGIYAKAKVTVPASKRTAYQTLLVKKGLGSGATVK
ncbi:MAG: leucine-rich repeat domain-containing protein [Eubacteriales bacterium]|nr:leucine-rich repeat domain-containing protein [Eubacteriales bacterium]